MEVNFSTYAGYQQKGEQLSSMFKADSSRNCDTRKDEACRQRVIKETSAAIDTWVQVTGYNPFAVVVGEAAKLYVAWATKHGRPAGGGDNTVYHHGIFPYLPVLLTQWVPCGPPDKPDTFWCYKAHDGIILSQLAATYMPAPGQVPYDSDQAPKPTVWQAEALWSKQTYELQHRLGLVDPFWTPLADGELVVMPPEAVAVARKHGLPMLSIDRGSMRADKVDRASMLSPASTVVVGTAVAGAAAVAGWAGWTYVYPVLRDLVTGGVKRLARGR